MKIVRAIIVIAIMLCIAVVISSDEISMFFAKNKPDNILHLHPEFSDMITKRESKPKNFICFYRSSHGVKMKKLHKKSFLNYQYTDDVPTEYSVKDGKVTGTYSTASNTANVTKVLNLFEKNVKFETLGEKTIEFSYVRAIVPSEDIINDSISSSHRNILCCELTGDIDDYIIYLSKNNVRAHRIVNKVINSKTYLIFNIKQDDLIDLDEIDDKSFFIEITTSSSSTFYKSSLEKLHTEKQKAIFEMIISDTSLGYGEWKRDVLILTGDLAKNTPRVTLKDAEHLLEVEMSENDYILALNDIAGAPDWQGGSGIGRAIYYLDDKHTEAIIVMLNDLIHVVYDEAGESTRKSIGDQQLQEPKLTCN